MVFCISKRNTFKFVQLLHQHVKETDYCWIHVPWFQQNGKPHAQPSGSGGFFWELTMRTGVYWCKFIPIMLYCMEPMDGKFQKKWRDAGIIQKLVLTQKSTPHFNISEVRWSNEVKIFKKGQGDMRMTCALILKRDKTPVFTHINHKVQNNCLCSQLPGFIGSSSRHWSWK